MYLLHFKVWNSCYKQLDIAESFKKICVLEENSGKYVGDRLNKEQTEDKAACESCYLYRIMEAKK